MGFLCQVCGFITEEKDNHEITKRHHLNVKLNEYKENKKSMNGNRHGAYVACDVNCKNGTSQISLENDSIKRKIIVNVQPKAELQFIFKIKNDAKGYDLQLLGLHLAHPQEKFSLDEHTFKYENSPHVLKKNKAVQVTVRFQPEDVGQFEMPIMFTFQKKNDEENKSDQKLEKIVIIREMVVLVDESPSDYTKLTSPFKNISWEAATYVGASKHRTADQFAIPKELKLVLTEDMKINEQLLESLSPPQQDQYRVNFQTVKLVFGEGRTLSNYQAFYHQLLWLDEIAAKRNMKKYNMSEVALIKQGTLYTLVVPGLAEKRPSLLRGDVVIISRSNVTKAENIEYEGEIQRVEESIIVISHLHKSFHGQYSPQPVYNVRFIMSRFPRECMHLAVSAAAASELAGRLFPREEPQLLPVPSIQKFYNPLIEGNEEQRAAVEHILARTSGQAPYMVYGPPGTGKTVTIVEAILQIVTANPKNQVWVCTDSNMAADHVAVQLLKYQEQLNVSNLLFRANSKVRAWNILPAELLPVSNGSSFESSYSMTNDALRKYRIIVTTLLHAAKYAADSESKLKVSHLFIDEAAQATEPACLVPLAGVLAPRGQLVLAGDPRQLGPIVTSKKARDLGLGTSLMEQLHRTYPNLYGSARALGHRYITMLVNNFRSDPDILEIPNEHFYDGMLKAFAPPDELSRKSLLGLEGGQRGIVFHGVNSKEQRIGKSPSFFNVKELEMVKRYVTALLERHRVAPEDVGVISPYMRQVTLIKEWLLSQEYTRLEVGTVEAFQGKEKRVIIVSTVRANSDLLGYDRKYDLGFLVDKKRFNVALTRAKAKLIIIGNKSCLERDAMWQCYLERCRQLGSYHGQKTEQPERTDALLEVIAVHKFNECGLASALRQLKLEKKAKKKNPMLNGH